MPLDFVINDVTAEKSQLSQKPKIYGKCTVDIKCVLHFSLQLLDTTLCPSMWFKELHASSVAMLIAKCEVII